MEVQEQLSPNQIKKLQTNSQEKIKRCKKIFEQKKKLRFTLEKMRNSDEQALEELYNSHYMHKYYPRCHSVQKNRSDLEESCENATLTIAKLLDEENELLEHIRQLEDELGHFLGEEQKSGDKFCCCTV